MGNTCGTGGGGCCCFTSSPKNDAEEERGSSTFSPENDAEEDDAEEGSCCSTSSLKNDADEGRCCSTSSPKNDAEKGRCCSTSSPKNHAAEGDAEEGRCYSTSSPKNDAEEGRCCSTSSPRNDAGEETLMCLLQRNNVENTPSQIDELVHFLNHTIAAIRRGDEHQTSASNTVEKAVDSVSSSINFASSFLDKVVTQVGNLKDTDWAKGLGDTVLRMMNKVGNAHWILLGLSVVSFTLQTWQTSKANVEECVDVLQEMADLAKNIRDVWDAFSSDTKRGKECEEILGRAIHLIVEAALKVVHNSGKKKFWKILSANSMKEDLQNIHFKMKELNRKLITLNTSTTAKYVMSNIPSKQNERWLEPSYDFQPFGIEERVNKVKGMVHPKGDEMARAVVIHGLGGFGKTCVAKLVIQEIKEECSGYIFCEAFVEDKGNDVDTKNITQLQERIIHSISGTAFEITTPSKGREKIAELMKGKKCLIFVDNVIYKRSVKELLPQNLSLWGSKMEPAEREATKVRIIVTSREAHFKSVFDIPVEEFDTQRLDDKSAKEILSSRIRQGGRSFRKDFSEEAWADKVAHECRGVPLILSTFGDHLRGSRDEQGKAAYENAITALREGKLDSFTDENLSNTLMFIFDNLRDQEWKESFLDICTYFHSWDWGKVSCILGESTLSVLQGKSLIGKTQSDTVVVHDILRVMGRNKAVGTRATNFEEFDNISKSNGKELKGLRLSEEENKFIDVESRLMDMMSSSLRVLILGGNVCLEQPSRKAFSHLRYMELGDVNILPFEQSKQIKELRCFVNRSLPGTDMKRIEDCTKLEYMEQNLESLNEYDEIRSQLQTWKLLKGFGSLRSFVAKCPTPLNLCQNVRFPSGLTHLTLKRFWSLPNLSHLANIQYLCLSDGGFDSLDGFCDFKFPKAIAVNLSGCKYLNALPKTLYYMTSLTRLVLDGCSSLKELPVGIGKLSALQELNLSSCTSLRSLPLTMCELQHLTILQLSNCKSLQSLPDLSCSSKIKELSFSDLNSLRSVPSSIANLSCLKTLYFRHCPSLVTLPTELVHMENLEHLILYDCTSIEFLPNGFDGLKSLNGLVISGCTKLVELPTGVENMTALRSLNLSRCQRISRLPESFKALVSMESIDFSDMKVSTLPSLEGSENLKVINIEGCTSLQRFPELPNVKTVNARNCPTLPGNVMDYLLRLPLCLSIGIAGSTQLMQRWEQLKSKTDTCSLISKSEHYIGLGEKDEEYQRAARAALLHGPSFSLSQNAMEKVTHHNMLVIPRDAAFLFLICLPKYTSPAHLQRLQSNIRRLSETDKTLFVCFRDVDNEVDMKSEDSDNILIETLRILPPGSHCYAAHGNLKRLLSLNLLFKIEWLDLSSSSSRIVCCHGRIQTDENGIYTFSKLHNIFISEDSEASTDEAEFDTRKKEDEDLFQASKLFYCITKIKKNHPDTYASKFGSDLKILQQALIYRQVPTVMNGELKEVETQDFLSSKDPLWVLETHFYETDVAQFQYLSHVLNGKFLWIVHFVRTTKIKRYGQYRKVVSAMSNSCLAIPKSRDWYTDNTLFYVNEDGMLCPEKNVLKEALLYGKDAFPFTPDQLRVCYNRLEATPPLDVLMGNFLSKNHPLFGGKLIFLLHEEGGETQTLMENLVLTCEGKYVVLYATRHTYSVKGVEKYLPHYPCDGGRGWVVLPETEYLLFESRCRQLRIDDPVEEEDRLRYFDLKSKEIRVALLDELGNVLSERGEEIAEMMVMLSHRRRRSDVRMEGSRGQEEIRLEEEMEESLKSGKCTDYFKDFLKERDLRTVTDARHEHPLSLVPYERAFSWPRNCYGCGLPLRRKLLTDDNATYGLDWYACNDRWCRGIYLCSNCVGPQKWST